MPAPGSESHQSPANASSTPSPTDIIDRPSSSSRMSRDSEGYPSWLPKRPPPPAPASTFQSSILGGLHDLSPSPVEPTPFAGGRKPTPRSVRIVSLQDSFVGAVEKDTRFRREPTEQTRVGVHVPPKVWTRATGVPPTAFNTSEQDEFLPLPQPRFNAKNLNLQILRHPSRWMKLYFYTWPLLVFYHIPLQTFFDFNAVFMLLQVAKYPNPLSSGKNWALGAAAYIACWLVWILVVCVVYELIYSFTRRWRIRRPLMLPIYLSSPAFNYAALTSYTNFSFLQHLRYTGFFPEPAPLLPPNSPSDPDYDFDDLYDDNQASWKSGIAETCYFYSQNLPTVALLLPRAGLCLALLFAFSSAPAAVAFLDTNSSSLSSRDGTFFNTNGSLTSYSRGILIANAAWTAWRILVLSFSWLGLWILSNQRLGGLCGPRHTWEENEQEKTRSVYSEAASEYGAYQGSFHHPGDAGPADYGGDELPWEWREVTRMRVQDAFEFCIASRRTRSGSSGGLRWTSDIGAGVVPSGNYAYRHRRYRSRHMRRRSAKGKEPSNEKGGEHVEEEPFEGLEKVLAAVGFPSAASPSRRGALSEDLFAGPASTSAQPREHHPSIAPLQYEHQQPKASGGMFTGLETPKMAKRNSKDKIPGSSGAGPLMSLPYPFSKPGAGHVSSKDSVPFPGTKSASKKSSRTSGKSSKSESSESPSTSSGTGSGSGSGSGSGGGSVEEEDDEEEDEDEDEDDDDDDEDDEDEDEEGRPSSGSGRASASMSSLGQPINTASRYPFSTRRPTSAGHARNPSGVSSGMSSGPGVSGGSHAHSQSICSHGTRSGGMSVLTQSTGNHESTDSEFGVDPRERARLSQGSSIAGSGVIPMPPRHPHPQTNGRGRAGTAPASTSAAAAAHAALQNTPIAFPSVRQRRRVDSGRGIPVDPLVLHGEGIGSDIEGQYEDDFEDEDDEDEEEAGEQEDHVGLLGVPSGSRVSLANSSSSGQDSRSRTHSSFSVHSSNRSRRSSMQARSRSRPNSTHSVRERTSSLGASMRSLMQGATASLSQLELVMRGATGPAAGLGGLAVGNRSRPRSRNNSSMARLEEDVVFSLDSTELEERRASRAMSAGSGSGSQSGNGNGGHGRGEVLAHPAAAALREAEEAEGYSSSGGTHSRSGSESLNGENYTFGRPMLFMRPAQEQPRVEEEDEGVVMERSTGSTGRGSPSRTRPISFTGGDPPSVSVSVTESFYSANPSQRIASPSTPMARPRSEHSPSPPISMTERQGIDIPRNQQRLLVPPGQRWLHTSRQPQGAVTSSSDSPPDISTAAGSFVTAAATLEGATTTGSSEPRSMPSSWEGSVPALGARVRDTGGMVERPGDDMGASGDAWRVV